MSMGTASYKAIDYGLGSSLATKVGGWEGTSAPTGRAPPTPPPPTPARLRPRELSWQSLTIFTERKGEFVEGHSGMRAPCLCCLLQYRSQSEKKSTMSKENEKKKRRRCCRRLLSLCSHSVHFSCSYCCTILLYASVTSTML